MRDGRRLKVCGVGAGYFAQFHHEAWQRLDRADLAAVADTDAERARASGATAYHDAEQMIRAERPDIVDIATPPETHLPLIELALGQGVSTVICQKPFCGTIERARQACAMADAANALLIVHENFRFQPWYRAIRRELEAGRIGTPLQASFRLRPGDGQGPEAYLARQPYFQQMPRFLVHETAVHWIDTFRYLLGEPRSVYADLRQLNPAIAGEDAGYFVLGYDDGVRAMFDGNRLLDHAAENHRLTMGEFRIEGSDGELAFGGDGVVRHRVRGARETVVIAAPDRTDRFGGDCVYALQKHVVDGLLDGTPIENRASEYLRVMELEELVYRADELGRRLPCDGSEDSGERA